LNDPLELLNISTESQTRMDIKYTKEYWQGKVKWAIIFIPLIPLIGCAGTTPVGSEGHKATILYFEGGSGRIIEQYNRNARKKLINRSSHYFWSEGIKLTYLGFNFHSRKGQIARTTDSHFGTIQKKVDKLREKGHDRIFLMGLSNGAISVMHAGANKVQGAEGLIVINPPRFTYNPYSRSGTIVDFKKITLPFLLITHKEDHGLYKGFSADFFRRLFPASIRPEIVTFSGGHTGTSPEATHLSQLYQHGLRGLEKVFAQTVIDFIDSNSDVTATGK